MIFLIFRKILLATILVYSIVKSMDIPPFCDDVLKNPHGEPPLFTNPFGKPGRLTEKFYFLNCIFDTFPDYVDAKHLFQVGTYIAAHKYFATDPRFKGEKLVNAEFFKKFPTPEVSDMDPTLKKQCETSATDCVTGVFDRLSPDCGSPSKSGSSAVPATSSFKTDYEVFVFRQTAMYYLCWYTMKRDRRLMYKPRKPAECTSHYTEGIDLDFTCLAFLYTSAENEPEFRRENWLDSRLKSGVIDYRASYEYMKDPFQCAELWFCPDPCYPREDLYGLNPTEDLRQAGNPCGKLKNPRCKREPRANKNFVDLIGNRFNISCDCRSSKKGTFWNSQCNRCMDMTEDPNVCYKEIVEKQSVEHLDYGESPSYGGNPGYGESHNYGESPGNGGLLSPEESADIFMSGFSEEEDPGLLDLFSSAVGMYVPMETYYLINICFLLTSIIE